MTSEVEEDLELVERVRAHVCRRSMGAEPPRREAVCFFCYWGPVP